MIPILEIACLLLVAVGFALPLAHALELPGKMRLTQDQYLTVQKVYYPGFTVGAFFGEFGATLATLILLIATPRASASFPFVAAAFAFLLLMHALYWVLTHPVNKFWLKDATLGRAGASFFAVGGAAPSDSDWVRARDRWEWSHVARAVCAFLSLAALALALALP